MWKWHWPKETGVYAQVELLGAIEVADNENMDTVSKGGTLPIRIQTAGITVGQFASVVFRKQSGNSGPVRLRFSNAFHDSTASIKDLQVVTLGGTDATPLGVVGISAADEENLPGCVEEMVQHYDHYHNSAKQFAEKWYEQHDPRRTIANLLSVEQLQQNVA